MKVFPRGVCSLLLLVLGGLSMNAAAEGEAPYSGSAWAKLSEGGFLRRYSPTYP